MSKTTTQETMSLFTAAWRVLRAERAIIVVQALATLCAVACSVVGVWAWMEYFGRIEGVVQTIVYLLATGIVVTLLYQLVVTYLAGAVMYVAFERFAGRSTTTRHALRGAYQKRGILLKLGALTAAVHEVVDVVGWISQGLAERIAAAFIGVSWDVATVFAVPLAMRSKEKNPLALVRMSADILGKTWKRSLFVGIGATALSVTGGLAVAVLVIVAIVAYVMSVPIVGYLAAVTAIIVFFVTHVILDALNTILKAALYYRYETNQLPAGFDDELLRKAFTPKKQWLS